MTWKTKRGKIQNSRKRIKDSLIRKPFVLLLETLSQFPSEKKTKELITKTHHRSVLLIFFSMSSEHDPTVNN